MRDRVAFFIDRLASHFPYSVFSSLRIWARPGLLKPRRPYASYAAYPYAPPIRGGTPLLPLGSYRARRTFSAKIDRNIFYTPASSRLRYAQFFLPMYRYYGEGSGDCGGYYVSFTFSVIPSSCEVIVYDTRARQTYYLENDSYVIGDSISRRLPTDSASRLIRQRGLDLRILMVRMPGPSSHPLAPDRLWMDFRISWEPAFVNIRWEDDSLRILCSIESAGDDGGSWARPRSPPPGRPEVLRSGGDRVDTHAENTIHRAYAGPSARTHRSETSLRPPGFPAPSATAQCPGLRPDA